MKQKLIAAVMILFSFTLLVSAQKKSSLSDQPVEIKYEKHILKNGLTLLLHEDHKAPIVAVNVWYHVGSKNEKFGKTGFAHLFEHLMFNGSENFNDDYFKVMEKIGATDLNGTTSSDRTNYFQNVPKSAFDLALWMESDRMGHLVGAINQAKLDEQRGVVQNEKRQGENEPYGKVDELIVKSTYPAGHPYSWTVIGSMEDLNAASLDDVKDWFKTYYGAANATLVVAGDINPQEALQKVEKYFGDIPSGPPIVKYETWVPKMTGSHRQVMQDRVPQSRIYKVWNVPQWGSQEGVYLDLVSDVLASGKTSRLYKRLVYDDQIATSARAYVDLSEIAGQFYIDLTAKPGEDLAKVEKAGDEELQKFLKDGPTEKELEKIKTQSIAQFVRGIERIGGFGGKSDILAQNQVFAGDADHYKQIQKWVKEATAKDLLETARKWLSDGVYILEVHPFPTYEVVKSDADRSKLPDAGTPPDAKFPDFKKTTLSNGMKIILAERKEIPVVNMSLLFDAGFASDQFGLKGTASLAMNMLDEGTKTRNALQISEELESLGANLSTGSNLDMSSVNLSSLKSNLDKSLDIFADVVLNPSFPEADFNRLKKQQIAGIKQEKSSPFSMALRVFPKILYGENHAYGSPFTGSGYEESVNKITREDLIKFQQDWLKPNNATLVVVGDITLEELTPKIEKLFKDWKKGEIKQKNIAHVEQKEKPVIYILDKPGAMQSVIIAGQVTLPTSNPDEIAINLMNDILGGNFTSRINMNIREDKHWSYGARSIFVGAKGQRPFLAYAPVQSDKTKESIIEIQKELTGITGEVPIKDDELNFVVTNQVNSMAGSWETGNAVRGSLSEMVRFGLPDDYFSTFAGKVKAATKAELMDAAKKAIHPNQLVWVVVGDRAKIEQGLKDMNLGEVKYMDADGNEVK
ncbi:MAG: pitrilysin family protein [Ignavibacteriaceae bacterium]